jgi:hydrogenase small subunit
MRSKCKLQTWLDHLKQPDCVEAQSHSREWTMTETYYHLMRRQGISRRSFLKFCSLTAASLGLGDAGAQQIAQAMQTKPRTPVIWLHGLECTCCSESFIRTAHPLAKDVVLSMISLDYDDTLMAAAGYQAEEQLEKTIEKYKGNYILAVEGNPPLADDGVYCIPGGKPFVDKLRHVAKDAKAIISWGSCASWGCVQAAKPNPTQATPVHKVITDKPIIKVPGCPPIAEVMTGVVTYILTFDRLPDMDAQGRPKMFYSQRIHDKCYRRPHFDAGQFVEQFDDAGARQGYCLYKMGCKGPVTYNACSTVGWNEGTSFPIQSGHGCIGCSEDAFWDKGSFYDHLTTIRPPGGLGIEGTADRIGLAAVAVAGAAVAAHAAVSAIKQARSKTRNDQVSETEK